MKILLAIILIFPIFNIVAQNPVQPKDSTVGKDELIIISPEKKVHSDTSELMIIRDSSQKHKEANISELFIIGRNAYKRGHICKNDQYPPFEGHWSGFYYGFVNFGNTDYSMYEGTAYEEYGEFMELDWSHSFAMLSLRFFRYRQNPRNYLISRVFVCFYMECCARDRTRTYTSHDTRS